MTDLFTPIRVGSSELPNRLFMAPMTRSRAPDRVANALMQEYYVQRAGAGLIITEACQISPRGVGYPGTPGIHDPQQTAGWRAITGTVHGAGGHIYCQLWHVGRISHPELQPDGALPVAPSAIRPAGQVFTPGGLQPFVTPRALETDEIRDIVADYAHAARCALEGGFDGVEIHAANGYLIDQFLRDGSNRRTDAYGGPIENRMRFLGEVVEAVTGVWESGQVGVRLSPLQPFNDMRDSSPETSFSYIVEQLNVYGLGYLHVTGMGSESPGSAGPAFDTGRLRSIWNGVYIANGGYDKARAAAAIATGSADAVAFGTLFLANPDLVERLRRDAPLNPPDPDTFYAGGAKGYTDYPALDSE